MLEVQIKLPPRLEGLNYIAATLRLWVGFVKERKPLYGLAQSEERRGGDFGFFTSACCSNHMCTRDVNASFSA